MAGRFEKVRNTDCTAWAIHPTVISKLKSFTSHIVANELGWGIDMLAIALAQLHNMLVLRDYTYTIEHHGVTGYTATAANKQMKAMLRRLPRRISQAIYKMIRENDACFRRKTDLRYAE